jgi:hypothetical protein
MNIAVVVVGERPLEAAIDPQPPIFRVVIAGQTCYTSAAAARQLPDIDERI